MKRGFDWQEQFIQILKRPQETKTNGQNFFPRLPFPDLGRGRENHKGTNILTAILNMESQF